MVMSGEEVGAKARGGETLEVRTGNAFPLQSIPVGTQVHNVEMHPGAGGQICRSAGSERPVGREGRQVRHPPPPLGRDAHGIHRLPRHRGDRQ